MNDNGERIILCHYPMAEWAGYFKGWYHAHGHIHNRTDNDTFKYLKTQQKALNAGVDINHFKPVTLAELIVNNKVFKEKNE